MMPAARTERRTPFLLLGALTACLAWSVPATGRAQSPAGTPPVAAGAHGLSPFGRPPVSPYLNLLRGGDPVLNYYGLVRPELELRGAQAQLRRELERVERRGEADSPSAPWSALGPTGHRSRFLANLTGRPESVEIEMQRRGARPAPSGGLRPTGHGTYFGNPATYFPSRR